MKLRSTNPFRSATLAAAAIVFGVGLARAASYSWDASGSGPLDDGGGTWTSSGGTNWYNGTTYGAWGNTTNDEAIFGVASGTAGTVTVNGTVNANKLTFNAPGSGNYTLVGGTINFGGTNPTITGAANATIDSALTGTAFRKTGTGILSLSGTSTFTGSDIWIFGTSDQTNTLRVLSGANISARSILLLQDGNTNVTQNYIQTGGTVTLASDFGIGASTAGGASGSNTATISGGTLTANGLLYLYKWANSTLNVSNSGVVNATTLRIGWVDSSPTGTINIGDGTTFSGGSNIKDGGTSGVLGVTNWSIQGVRNYTLNFKGGTFKAGGTGAGFGSGTFTSATVQDAGGIIDNNGNNITIGQVLAHGGTAATDGGLVFKGTATTTLSNANTFNGGILVKQGTLVLSNASAAGSGAITLGDASTGNGNITLTTTTNNSTPITVSAANTGTGTVVLSQSTNTTALTGTLTLNRATTIYGGGDRVGVDGKITGSVGTLTFSNGRTTLGNATNDFTGDVVVAAGGTLQINATNGAIPDASSVTVSGTVKLNTSSTSETIGGLNGGGTVQNHESVGGAPTLTMGGGDKSGVFTGSLTTGSGTFNIAKTGIGTQELSGANINYNGATTLNNGTLKLTNTSGFNSSGIALHGSNTVKLQLDLTTADKTFSNITGGASANSRIEKLGGNAAVISSGNFAGTAADALKVTAGTLYVDAPFTANATVAGTIGGRGTIGNAIISSGGAIEGGRAGTGTLTTGNLTFDGAGTVRGTLAAGYTPISVQALTINGGTGSVALSATGAGLVNGNYYDVISYASTNVTDATAFTSGSRAYSPFLDTGAKKVQLYYDATASIYWTGANGSAWDTSATSWKLSGNNSDTRFMANDVVYFNDNPTTSTVDISNGNVTPLSVTFSNATTNYTLQGSNGIASGTLAKSGAATLTINNSNSHTGGTTLSGGTVELGHAGALGGSGAITMDGGTLRYSASNNTDYSSRMALVSGKTSAIDTNGRDVTFSAALATSGGTAAVVVKTGTGTLTLNGNNTWSGGTTVSAGTLRIDGGFNGYGAGTGVITLGDANTPAGGATLGVYGANWGAGPDRWVQNDIVVAATSPGAGPLVISRPTGIYAATIKGTITLNNNLTFRNTSGDRLAIEGKITGTGNVTIESNGPRVNFDNSANDYVGTTTIASGAQLQLNNNNVVPATSDVTVHGRLSFQSDAATALTIGALNGSGTVDKPWGSGTPVLTVGATGNNGDFSGSIGSNIGLTKTGGGTQTVSGANITYSGNTTVNNGRLKLTDTTSFNSNVTVNGGTLELNRTTDSWSLGKTLAGSGSVEKTGDGTVTLGANSSTFAGTTTVSAGALFISGQLGGNVEVGATTAATIGGAGTIGGSLTLGANARLDVTGGNLLTLGGALTLTDFGFGDIIGWDASTAETGTYLLMDGVTSITFNGSTPTISNQYDFGGGKKGYFELGSLRAVIVPEPSSLLLAGLGSLALLRRRRA
ncbi:MAG: autotransporter-associated beta strand repeat-containing protein [Verrucomicrobia bacterium]|nr:autotransporter-associated beta strand repeat-containing protein [Verrucomicrobiota bacterium]